MVPYFTKVIAYDALAAVGTAGQDVLDAFGIVKELKVRTDVKNERHKIVGVPAGQRKEFPGEANFDGKVMGTVITALMKGSILAVRQGL